MNKEIAVFKTDTETINVEVLIEEGELAEHDSMRKFGFSEFSSSTIKQLESKTDGKK